MNIKNTWRGFTQQEKEAVICSPCGESVAQATKEGQNKEKALWPLLPRLTAVLPPQGREMSWGFTLIELLVVVLIIGILAAVAVPQYQKTVEKSRVAEAKTILNAMRKNYQLCVLEFGNSDDNECTNYSKFIPDHVTIDLPGTWETFDKCAYNASSCVITKDWSYETDDLGRFYAVRLNQGSVKDSPYLLYIDYATGSIVCSNSEADTCDMLCGGDYCEP